MIDLHCPKCGESMSVPSSLAGQAEPCPQCGHEVAVPVESPAPPVTAAAMAEVERISPQTSDRPDIKTRLLEAMAIAQGKGTWMADKEIVPRKLTTARERYASAMPASENAIVMVNFGDIKNYKKGVLLSERKCYYHTKKDQGAFEYNQVESFTSIRGFTEKRLDAKLFDGTTHTVSFRDTHELLGLEIFLNSLIPKDTYDALLHRAYLPVAAFASPVKVDKIPEKKLATARSKFAESMPPEEKVIVFVFYNPFGSAKEGILLTCRSCYHCTDGVKGRFPLSAVVGCDHPGGNKLDVVLSDGSSQLITFTDKASRFATQCFFMSLALRGPAPSAVADGSVSAADAAPVEIEIGSGRGGPKVEIEAPWAPKVGGFLGLLGGFIFYQSIGGIGGLIIGVFAASILSIPFIIILSFLFGKRVRVNEREQEPGETGTGPQ